MDKSFIMTAFGKDRPGIVADVTGVLFDTGCNLEDTTMTRLADEFTLILLFTGQGEDLNDRLHKECRRLEIEKGLSAFIRPVEIGHPEPAAGEIHTIQVEGLDQAGIVYKISRYLASKQINIEKLTSRNTFSPESGAILYSMEVVVRVPEGLSVDDVEEGLDPIANELNVDITVS